MRYNINKDLFRNNISELEDGILEVVGLPNGEYDAQAVKYDTLISNGLYNRLMWGNSPNDYTNFCRQSINECDTGIIADIGCGTLSFTSKVYEEIHKRDLFVCDLSYEMLKIGKNRIKSTNEEPSKISFLRSDALNMPFVSEGIQTVLSFGFLHVIDNPSNLISEFNRILMSEGKLYLTSLCTDRTFSAKYLYFLHKKGHVAKPMNSTEIERIVEDNGFRILERNTKGGMIYLTAIKETLTHNNVYEK
jgi:SAM-dependent methyltransferase